MRHLLLAGLALAVLVPNAASAELLTKPGPVTPLVKPGPGYTFDYRYHYHGEFHVPAMPYMPSRQPHTICTMEYRSDGKNNCRETPAPSLPGGMPVVPSGPNPFK